MRDGQQGRQAEGQRERQTRGRGRRGEGECVSLPISA